MREGLKTTLICLLINMICLILSTGSPPATEGFSETNTDENLIKSIDFSNEDAEMLMKIAMAEAGGEGRECMALVMLTVLNRTWSDNFPDNIHDVIYESTNGVYQFSPIANGAYDKAVPNEACKEALELIMSGWDKSQNALYFESCPGSSWHSRNLQFLYQCGRMRFYK